MFRLFVRNVSRIAARHIPATSKLLLGRVVTGGSMIVGASLLAWQSNMTHCGAAPVVDRFHDTAMYPPIKYFDTGRIQVSKLHTIQYWQYGNPKGKPVLFVHGGPGGGTEPTNARFFDPAVYRIILVDQRGCGESTPFAEIKENTTYDLVSDFEKVREKLGISKWQVFGGSWGSTLGLAYSIEHPDRVSEIVLRGVFLLREEEIQWYYQYGAHFIYPDAWERYKTTIPEGERSNFLKAYHRRLNGELGKEEMHRAAKAWSVWEGRTSRLVPPTDVAKFEDDKFSLAFARIENHYFTNKAFFPRDGFLIEKSSIDRIRHIPTVIVQGRYDVVCPMKSAYDLHKAFPESQLVVTLAGHSAYETETIKYLVEATDKFKEKK